jgi:hypothetical protein
LYIYRHLSIISSLKPTLFRRFCPIALPLPSPDTACSVETHAALALGRLDGALRYLPAGAGRILAARRQEGHAFSDQRFAAWFAGLLPLVDPADRPTADLRPPRAMVAALLHALGHSSWAPLASLAVELRPAFMAWADEQGEEEHGAPGPVLEDARDLLAALPAAASPLPFDLLRAVHRAVAASPLFAPGEFVPTPLRIGDWRVTVARPPSPSPRWAVEVLLGEPFYRAGYLPHALPLTGLLRLDALDGDSAEARTGRAEALLRLAEGLGKDVGEVRALADDAMRLGTDRRSTSRVPALYALLAGFGAMRSAQLERLLGVSRLGLRKMLSALEEDGCVSRTTIGGVHLYYAARQRSGMEAPPLPASPFTSGALLKFDAAMDEVDALLARLRPNDP